MANDNYSTLILRTDGGSRNNPGHAGIGFVIEAETGEILEAHKKYIGIATNNEAEYQALLSGLTHVVNFYSNCKNIQIFADSELMIRQVTGIYKIREEHLKRYATSIKELLEKFATAKLTHVLRKDNKAADKLVNEALDEKLA